MTDAERETLEQLMHYMERKSAMKDAAAIREVLAENERLRDDLEQMTPSVDAYAKAVSAMGAVLQPGGRLDDLGKSIWGRSITKDGPRLLADEIDRLKGEVIYEQERNANNVRAYSEEVERLRIESGSQEIRAQDGWARIEAAMALAEYVVALADDSARIATDPRSHVAIGRAAERVVEALKGGK